MTQGQRRNYTTLTDAILDGHYHDQAQFVLYFHEFMGMTPSHYAAMGHPILREVVLERARFSGSSVLAAHQRNQTADL